MAKSLLRNRGLIFLSRLILGGLFIYASIDKALNPLEFAQIIHNYRITPPSLINFAAIILPWIELLTGALLILGVKVRGANIVIGGLLVFYIALLATTAARGINVACGCFSTSTAAKSNLTIRIIEDIAMLLPSMHVFFFHKAKN